MNKHIKYIIAAVLLTGCIGAKAQVVIPRNVYYAPGTERNYLINWMERTESQHRYTIAIRPIYLSQNGLKLDFEYELKTPGQWLQLELIGHYAPEYKEYGNGHYGYHDPYYTGWSQDFLSGGKTYHSLFGIGGGISYKSFFSRNGWYYTAGLTFNYFDVEYFGAVYTKKVEDGLTSYIREEKFTNTKFYKPEINFNVGKHFALGRSLFLDTYIGFGYAYSFYEGDTKFSYNSYSFGGRGFQFNAGFRIGWLFGK